LVASTVARSKPGEPEAEWLFLQFFHFALQARVAGTDDGQIADVDDPGDGVGGEQIRVGRHQALLCWRLRISMSERMA